MFTQPVFNKFTKKFKSVFIQGLNFIDRNRSIIVRSDLFFYNIVYSIFLNLEQFMIRIQKFWGSPLWLDSEIMVLWTVAWARAGCFGWDIDLKIKFIDIRRMSTADFFMNILLHVKIILYMYHVSQNIVSKTFWEIALANCKFLLS